MDDNEDRVTDEKIAALIVQLGDSSFTKRVEAENGLLQFGESALEQLTNAVTETREVEVKFRAAKLIEKIVAGLQESRWLGIKFAFLERGEFSMGSQLSEKKRRDDESPHQVNLSTPFMIAQREIAQKDYLRVMELSPSWYSKDGGGKEKVELPTEDFAVDSVSWFDAIEFCNQLSRRDEFPPYYEITNVEKDQDSIVSADVKIKGGNGYRLPTEAEWEYACRAGSSTPYHFGEAVGKGAGNFQYRRNAYSGSTNYALGRTTTVGSYKPNAWGLYDMHGNVAEWCWDFYDESYYEESPRTDPFGPLTGHHRVLRGGSFLVNETRCRSASRFWSFPGEGNIYTGFRVARTPNKIVIEAFSVK